MSNGTGGLSVPTTNVSQTASNLLQQIAATPQSISSIQITLNLEQQSSPTIAPTHSVATASSGITWVRQRLDNNDIAITSVPDDASQPIARTTVPPDPIHEKATWEGLLGNPAVDIDTGTTLLRLSPNGESGSISWLPADHTAQPIQRQFKAKNAPSTEPGVGIGLVEFQTCMNTSGPAPIDAFVLCLPMLLQ